MRPRLTTSKNSARWLPSTKLPDAVVSPGKSFGPFKINGVRVRFSPHLLLRRVDKTNKQRRGSFHASIRERKSAPSNCRRISVGGGIPFLQEYAPEEGSDVDKTICVMLDALTGEA